MHTLVDIKNMDLDTYIDYFNRVLYPKNYPYFLRTGIRADAEKLSIIVQIGIPKSEIEGADFDIDKPSKYDFQDLLTVTGKTDEEVIKVIESIDWNLDHKEYFRELWKQCKN